jgi:isoquinoline 1-oxidoreductase subunit beta
VSGVDLTRRDFLGGALCLGVYLAAGCGGSQRRMIRRADATGELAPNMYVTVMPDGRVGLVINKTEMGQGVTTGYATLVAEELEVDLSEVDFSFADAHPKYRTTGAEGIPMFRIQTTGGSTSLVEAFVPLRQAAAAAREMLVAAGAGVLGVRPADCVARSGHVVHPDSGRRLGYGALTRQAARQPVPDRPRIKEPEEFRLIGKPVERVDGRAKVDGSARFAIDLSVPRMARAFVVHPPVFGADPTAIRADAARGMPGVIDVFGIRGGVAVVAERYWQALRAARHVEVEWGRGQTAGLSTGELVRAALAHEGAGTRDRDDGDVDRELGAAGRTLVEAVYLAPYLAHAPMEPQSCVVEVKGRSAEVWAGCQTPTVVQEAVADAIGGSAGDVEVHTTYAGGGFGRRLVADYAVEAAQISRRVKRPVQLVWSRESDTRQGYYRPAAVSKLRGAAKDGRATALSIRSLSQPVTKYQLEGSRGGQPSWVPALFRHISARASMAVFASNTLVDLFALEGASDTPYRIPNLRADYTPIDTAMPVGFWRSVGHSFNAFAMESFVDELAHAAGRDPYQFRREMLAPGSRELRVLDAAAALAGWERPAQGGFARGLARHTSFGTEVAQVAEVGVEGGRIRVKRVFCVVDCGLAVNPDLVAAQMESGIIFGMSAALDQEITLEDGVVQQGNFDDYPALRMHECPEIVVEVQDSAPLPTGAGEPGLPPIAPAIANGLFAATGVRLRRMPMQRAWDQRSER